MSNNVVLAFVALVIVLGLIAAVAWLVRRFGAGATGSNANRGRMPRLAVIDAAAVDGRRRLVLVRRDNIEHLIMIGGPTDVVVEANILRSNSPRDQIPQRGPAGTELPARAAPLDTIWPDTESFEPREPAVPELPARSSRTAPAFPDEVRRPSPSIADWNPNDLSSGLSPEPSARSDASGRTLPRSERTEPRMPRPSDPAIKAPPRPPSRPAEPPLSSADQNLAEMAQRLEAALRRPAATEPRAEGAPAPANNAASPQARPVPRPQAPAAESKPAAAPSFDNLEDEMASLLGRPKPPA